MTTAKFITRDDLAAIAPGVTFRVDRYSHAAKGGPKVATISASGDPRTLRELLTWLLYGVEITNNNGQLVWWGYVESVEYTYKGVTYRSTLDSLFNRVAVAYTTVAVGDETVGVRGTTDWAENADSILEFGIHELMDSFGGTTSTVAENLRDRKIALTGLPRVTKERGHVMFGEENTAVITCRGWWWSLEWQYCTIPTQLALSYWQFHSVTGQSLGTTVDNERMIQTFTVGPNDLNVLQIGLRMRKLGSPTDNVTVALYSITAANEPDQSLGSVSMSGVLVGATYSEVRFTLSSSVDLTANTHYAIVITRSGDPDVDDYYRFYVDSPAGYGGGICRIEDSSNDWNTQTFDLPFRIYTNVLLSTSQQVANIINAYGEYLGNVQLETASGITSESYRNGTFYAMDEANDLLEAGTTNNRRLLATVTPSRIVRVYEEPAASAATHYIDDEGNIYDGAYRVDPSTCPVGIWVMDKDTPKTNETLFSWSEIVLIEEAEYDCETGKLSPLFFGQLDILQEIGGGIQDG